MQCVLVLIAVRFGAKCSVFWCKTQGKMLQNAVQNGEKCKRMCIKIQCHGTDKTSSNHETHGKKRQNGR